MRLKTIQIQSGDGFLTINERDFDPKKHALFGDAATEATVPPAGQSLDEAAEVVEPFESAMADEKPKRKRGK